MPLVYRAMLIEDGKPKIGPEGTMLGVRPGVDISANADGNVMPNTGGMSVTPAWRKLPGLLIPERLNPLCPKARGRDDLVCWRMGDGLFESSPFAERLNLHVNKPAHGTVQPAEVLLLDEYQAALAATQDKWFIDEA